MHLQTASFSFGLSGFLTHTGTNLRFCQYPYAAFYDLSVNSPQEYFHLQDTEPDSMAILLDVFIISLKKPMYLKSALTQKNLNNLYEDI